MSDLQVNIDGESMQKAIVQAVADSTIGEHIKTAIDKALKESRGYGSKTLLEEAASSEINSMIGKITKDLLEEKKEDIKAMIYPLLTDEIVGQMAIAAFEVMLGNLKKGSDRY